MHEANPKTDLQYVAEHRLSAAHRLAQLQKRTAFVRGHRGVGGGRDHRPAAACPGGAGAGRDPRPAGSAGGGDFSLWRGAVCAVRPERLPERERPLRPHRGACQAADAGQHQDRRHLLPQPAGHRLSEKQRKGDQHLLQQRRKHGSHLEHPDRPADQPDRLWRLSGVAVGAASAAAGGGAGHHGGKLPVQQPHQRLGLPPPGRGEGIP